MPKIVSMYCFAMSDKDPDDEGVPAFAGPGGSIVPLVGADIERIASLMPVAQQVANECGQSLRIYSFTNKKQIGEVNPRKEAEFRMPNRCYGCNALLTGGATNHSKECEVKKMIDSVLKEVHKT